MDTMSATLTFSDNSHRKIEVNAGESLLHAAERQQVMLPNSCREGTCGSCIGRCDKGTVRQAESAIGLARDQKEAGYVLPCQLTVESNAEFSFDFDSGMCQPGDDKPFPATVVGLTRVGEGAALLTFQAELTATCSFRPG